MAQRTTGGEYQTVEPKLSSERIRVHSVFQENPKRRASKPCNVTYYNFVRHIMMVQIVKATSDTRAKPIVLVLPALLRSILSHRDGHCLEIHILSLYTKYES